MAKTYEELLEQAAIIRDETAAGKNTATRVGGTITDAVDYVKELQDTYAGIHAEAAEAKTEAAAAKSTASEAKMNATAAMNTARSASLNATAASGTANEAKETAQEAKEVADAASSTAADAKATAETAKATAETAQTTATSANKKNAEQDNRLANAEEQNTKQNERLLNYVYPKLYQLNEGAGAHPFDGMYSGSASVLDGRKTVAEEGYTYKVVFALGKFLLQEISPGGVTIGLYEEWDNIISGRGSSEDYAKRDRLYYVYTEGEGSYYYYVDADGNISEKSGTYVLRKLIDETKAKVSTNTEKLDVQERYVAALNAASSEHSQKIDAIEGRAGNIETKNAEQDKRLANLLSRMNTQEEVVVALPFHGFTDAAADNVMLFKPKDTYSYRVLFSTASNSFVLRVTENVNQTGKYIGTFSSWNAVDGAQASSYYERRDTLYKYLDLSYGAYRYYYYGEDGSFFEAPGTKYLSKIIEKQGGKIDENTQKVEELQAQVSSIEKVQDIPWAGRHMNVFIEKGDFHIHGERTDANDGLPILNAASGHTIDARLTVLDSSLTNGTGAKTDICVTQFLRLSNRTGGDGHVYVRTAQAATKSQLATPSSTAWSTWEKLMGMFEKNAVTNIADLDTYTTNGMYSGLFANTTLQTLGGLQFTPGDTFLLITVNGYAASAFGAPQLTQMLYKLPSKKGSGNYSARMYMRTAYWNKNADPKAWVWANWDRLATASEISGGGGGSIEEYNRLIELIAANTTKISSVESTANDAKSAAETAQTAATSAQETANSAQETATAASTAAQEAKSAAETAQSTATAAQEKNAAQDARLDNIEARIDPDIAGRVWNEDNGTPKAESYYGSVKALRDLPKRLGLGRYIVKDDRTRRKLDPNDSHKYLDDGSTANLDGTDGQCMWCWNGFYANIWHEGSRLIKAVTFDKPVGNDISIWIPAGGISWLGAGVIDRGDAPFTDKTKWKLCSVINNSEQFRGGGGNALDASKYSKAPAAESPQITMLGMPATMISTTDFGTFARKRGEGWEANWFVARFVVEFLFEIIMGTENSQEEFKNLKDADGLYQGGFGMGVSDMPDWDIYNGLYPVIPTSVGLEAGDGVCLVPYDLPNTGGAEGTYKTFNVPVFFGLVGAGYGNLYQSVRGIIMNNTGEEKSLAYVTPSMYAKYYPDTVEDKIMVAECSRVTGWITRKSYRGLCCIATEMNGSQNIRYSDRFIANTTILNCIRICSGTSNSLYDSGVSFTAFGRNTSASVFYTSPLCYFTEDPIIPDSQSIANNS